VKHLTLVKKLNQEVPQSCGQHGVKTGNWVATKLKRHIYLLNDIKAR